MKTKDELLKNLNNEFDEVNGRINRLTEFTRSKDFYSGSILQTQVSLLTIQLDAMQTYATCLKERITDIKNNY